MNTLTQPEIESILTLCLLASFADGAKHDDERQEIKSISDSLAGEGIDVTSIYQEVLIKKPELATVAARLQTAGSRQLAYEMAVGVCDADDVCNAAEKQFLEELRVALDLPATSIQSVDAEATALATIPVASPASAQSEETDAMILRYAIIGGALELLPQTMASLAIIPMQTRMVYRIGSERGITLDRQSIAEFMGAIGIGVTSQVVEGFARRLTRGLGGSFAGKLGGKLGDAVGGIAMSFASTYALGQLAKLYYDSGRRLTMESLKTNYPPLIAEGKALAQKYAAQITQQSQQLQGANIATLLQRAL